MKTIATVGLAYLVALVLLCQLYPGGKEPPVGQVVGKGGAGYRDISQFLVHYWEFDGDLTDSVGGYDLSVTSGSPSYEAAVFGQGMRHSSVQTNVAGITETGLTGAGAFTATGWVKQNGATQPFFYMYWPREPLNNQAWHMLGSASGHYTRIFIAQTNLIGTDVKGPELASADTWMFLAGRYVDPDDIALFTGINGAALVKSTTQQPFGAWTGPRRLDTNHMQGPYGLGVGDVTQDDQRIYSVALTDIEIAQLYAEGVAALGL